MKDKITPEYILEQSKIVDDETLMEIIEKYGEQEYDRGCDNTAGCYN